VRTREEERSQLDKNLRTESLAAFESDVANIAQVNCWVGNTVQQTGNRERRHFTIGNTVFVAVGNSVIHKLQPGNLR